ncbi:MAG TPA: hypothetical protein VMH86_05120 [Rhizomicrobium sp.]|nr:hypothetical protein [Rhizomicrobium sp.]
MRAAAAWPAALASAGRAEARPADGCIGAGPFDITGGTVTTMGATKWTRPAH